MHALGGPSTSSASTDALVKLLLDVADALLELLMTAAEPSALETAPSECSDSPAASGADAPGDRTAGIQQADPRNEPELGAGVTKKSLVMALRVLSRALASPGMVPRDTIKLARAFVEERYGLLGDAAGWPAQSAALQVRAPALLKAVSANALLLQPCCACGPAGDFSALLHERSCMYTYAHHTQVLYSLPHAQRAARRLLSAEQGRLAGRGCVPAGALARSLLLLGAMAQGYQAERTAFLQRLAAPRGAAGTAPESHAEPDEGAPGGQEAPLQPYVMLCGLVLT